MFTYCVMYCADEVTTRLLRTVQHNITSISDSATFNPFNANYYKLLLFEGFSACLLYTSPSPRDS